MSTYYIGADVHSNSTELAIEKRGKIVANPIRIHQFLARSFVSNARLLPRPTPESCCCTSRIRAEVSNAAVE